MIRVILSAFAAIVLPAVALAQTSIELRPGARVKVGAPVTLAHVAVVSGDDADTLGAAVIVEDPAASAGDSGSFELDLAAVRSALDKVDVRWGRTTLRGSACTVYVSGITPEIKKAKPAAPAPNAPRTFSTDGPATVRTQVIHALTSLFNVTAADLRLAFEAADDELLSTALTGKRVEVQPTNAASTSQVGLRVYVFAGDRIVTHKNISVQVLVRRTVVTAVAPVQRRQEITDADFTIGEQWLAPSAAVPCSPEQIRGSVAKSRINAGQLITSTHIEAPVVVKRGDIVEVHCLAGNVHLKATRARALASGRDGEIIEFQLEGSKKTFKARMSGRGMAVLTLEAPTIN